MYTDLKVLELFNNHHDDRITNWYFNRPEEILMLSKTPFNDEKGIYASAEAPAEAQYQQSP